MPTPYPMEFRRDVIAVARQGGQSIEQVARSFGIGRVSASVEKEDGRRFLNELATHQEAHARVTSITR